MRICATCGLEKTDRNFAFYGHYGKQARSKTCMRCVQVKKWHAGVTRPQLSTPHAMSSATLADIHWAAGFLEGEAGFRKGSVAVTQTDTEPLEKLQRLFGGTIRPGDKRYVENPNWTPQFLWLATGPRGRGVMMTIYFLMSASKKARILEALDHP